MKFYFSGYDAIRPGPLKDWVIQQCPWRLQSCHDVHMKSTMEWLTRSVEIGAAKEVDLMLDSGAFTAWNAGHKTTLEELYPIYSKIFQRFGGEFKSIVFINLDVIPGTKAHPPTEADINEALHESDINFERLTKRFGSCILPVFHQGESWARLEEVKQQAEYICISPRQTLSEKIRTAWVREVGSRASRENKLHGLATTGNTIIRASRWFSVDSASWVWSATYGTILLNLGGDLRSLAVSEENPGRYTQGQHINNLSHLEREAVEDQFRHYGFQLQHLATDNEYRRAFNLVQIRDWSKKIDTSKAIMNRGLFDD